MCSRAERGDGQTERKVCIMLCPTVRDGYPLKFSAGKGYGQICFLERVALKCLFRFIFLKEVQIQMRHLICLGVYLSSFRA